MARSIEILLFDGPEYSFLVLVLIRSSYWVLPGGEVHDEDA
jgi:hypothetical protein